jgi:hypothetical protein
MELLLVAADRASPPRYARLARRLAGAPRQLRRLVGERDEFLVVDGAGGGEHHVAGMVVPREIGADRVRA